MILDPQIVLLMVCLMLMTFPSVGDAFRIFIVHPYYYRRWSWGGIRGAGLWG